MRLAQTPRESVGCYSWVPQVLNAVGLPRQPFHNLRHCSASLMLAEGVALRTIMEILGHSQIAVTANLYGHVAPAAQQDALERVGSLLGSRS